MMMMSTVNIFRVQLVLGLLSWALVFAAYVLPWLRSLGRAEAQRVIAALNAFRFAGLAFLVPGVVGLHLPDGFAAPAAYGDLATSLLAICAFMSFPIRPLFWTLVVGFNTIGAADLIDAIVRTIYFGVPASAGQLGAAYFIPIVYVPLLLLTHAVAFYLLVAQARHGEKRASGAVAAL